MSNQRDELLRELRKTFATEAADHLQTLDQSLLQLERVTDAQRWQELLQEAFRAAHSLKGAARTVSVTEIEGLAAAIESILQKARSDSQVLTPAVCDVIYNTLDIARHLLNGKEVDLRTIHARLTDIGAHVPNVESNGSREPVHAESNGHSNLPENGHGEEVGGSENELPVQLTTEETIRVGVGKLDNLIAQTSELIISRISAEQRVVETRQIQQHLGHWTRTWRDMKMLLPRLNGDAKLQFADLLAHHNEEVQTLIRDIGTLHQNISRDTLRLGMVTTRLQDEVRLVRLVPFHTLALTLQRAVRDAEHIEGKRVALHITGGDVELDKKVLETLKDPLLHLLRNAVSHGIETPEERHTARKPPVGVVNLTVQQRGGEVRITLRDDGRGFDLEKLRLAGATQQTGLNPQATADELIALAFLPGVTTSPEVTVLSGRGVGLDVVRQQIESLQGRILVESVPGKGASIQLIVPVSLAMTRGLLVQAGAERYALPLLTVEKIIEPQGIFTVEGQAMLPMDGKPLPLIPLTLLLNRQTTSEYTLGNALVVILLVADQRLALLVNDVLTEQELAVKPLGKLLQQVQCVVGAALLSNGEPIVVLNAADLMKRAQGVRASSPADTAKADEDRKVAQTKILVVDDSITTRTLEKNILEAAGYEVHTATNGNAALKKLQENAVSLIVSDVQMPIMDGIALTQYIRESTDYKQMPIILVTSLESQEDRERGMMAGANAYIVKRGFDQAELLSTISQLL